MHRISAGLGELLLFVLVVFLFPLAILALGTPVVLLVRLILEIAKRL